VPQHSHEVRVPRGSYRPTPRSHRARCATTDDDRELKSPALHGGGNLYREKVNRRSVNGFVARGEARASPESFKTIRRTIVLSPDYYLSVRRY